MDQSTHQGQRLPLEIKIYVLRLLAYSNYSRTLGFQRRSETFGENLLAKLAECQRDLYQCTLICREWYQAGLTVLYACPYILSRKQLQLCMETLEARPDFVHLIQAVVVSDSPKASKLPPGVGDLSQDFDYVLSTCTSLSDITIYANSDPSFQTPLLPVFPGLVSRLRRVNFCGPGHYNLTPQHTLDSLETISISTCMVTHPFAFPSSPRLHTLQLAKTFGWRRSIVPTASEPEILGDCETLRTLELYINTPSQVMVFIPLRRPQIERLHLIGHAELLYFSALMKTEALDNLCHLVLGVLANGKHDIQSWGFPDNLVNLTCFVRHPSSNDGPLHCLLRCFQYNARISPNGKFPALTIYFSPGEAPQAPLNLILDDIREMGVTIECRDTRECTLWT